MSALPADSKERETGIEPATSSLGNRVAIEYQEHCVHGGFSESTESPAIPKI
jgi:hypothetical protein